MAKQDFENFKTEIKEWMDTHLDEYDEFVDEVNDKSASGLIKVFFLAQRVAPQLMKKFKSECHGDIASEGFLQTCTADDNTAQLLVDEFHNCEKESIVPAMLAWLFYGKCYETMVMQLEAERQNPRNTFFEKTLARIMMRFVISSSTRGGSRTKEDWKNFRKEREVEKQDSMADYINELDEVDGVEGKEIERESHTTKESVADKKSQEQLGGEEIKSLRDILLGEDSQAVFDKIVAEITKKAVKPVDLVRLYIALKEEGHIFQDCNVQDFYTVVSNTEELNHLNIGKYRNFVNHYSILMKPQKAGTYEPRQKDLPYHQEKIELWRTCLKV